MDRKVNAISKNLSQIDPIYESVTECMGVKDRISYCVSLIYETQHFLLNNSLYLDDKMKEKYEEIIAAAKIEIEKLMSIKFNS